MQPSTTATSSAFRYYHLKIDAQRLPGRQLRIDPLAVVYSQDANQQWQELGRTERRLNEWNPKFSQSITIPADTEQQRRADLKVDFYNKTVDNKRFLGSVSINIYALSASQGRPVEMELETPDPTRGHPRVFLTALEGFNSSSDNAVVHLSFQLMKTNYYGVAMKIFYEIARAGTGTWHPVYTSSHIHIDEQGYGQFPDAKISLKDLAADEEGTGLLISIYRHKILGPKRLLGNFQTNIRDLTRKQDGDLIPFMGNTRESLLNADVQVLHSQKNGSIYQFGLKLVNVYWNAEKISDV